MADLGSVDALWFTMHPEETHRIRHATTDEANDFVVRHLHHRKLLTVIRRADGAAVTYAFKEGDDINRSCSLELAEWFDADLDATSKAAQ